MKRNPAFPTLKQLLKLPTDPLEKFHDLTKFKKWLPQIPFEKWPKSWTTITFKEYPRLDKIPLPDPELKEKISIKSVLYNRHSSRKFSKNGLTLEQIGTLLFYSAGLKKPTDSNPNNRFYPSPGGRYTLETYLVSLNSELPKGVYHYNIKNHYLELLYEFKKLKKDYYFNQDWVDKASCLILVTTTFKRNTVKYGYRGYRHILAESGHLGQNFYLVGTALGLSLCAIGGYLDDRLNNLLDVDGLNETVIYPLAIGNPPVK